MEKLECENGSLTQIERLVIPLLQDMGYDLVRLRMETGKRFCVQVMIERFDGISIGVDDCAKASRAISAILDVEDLIEAAYHLEVSSPGLDRPLTKLDDFRRFEGYEAKVETHTSYVIKSSTGEVRKRRFLGRLAGVVLTDQGAEILLAPSENLEFVEKKENQAQTLGFSFSDLVKARLVLTDDLIADAKNRTLPPPFSDREKKKLSVHDEL